VYVYSTDATPVVVATNDVVMPNLSTVFNTLTSAKTYAILVVAENAGSTSPSSSLTINPNVANITASAAGTQVTTTVALLLKYSWHQASGTTADATGSVGVVPDASGNNRQFLQQAAASQMKKVVDGALTVLRSTGTTQGYLDASTRRVLPFNSSYTKMVVFNTSGNTIDTQNNYMPTYGTGSVSLLWLFGANLQATSQGNFVPEVNTTFVPAFNKWYAIFFTCDMATKAGRIYANTTAGTATLLGSGTMTNSFITSDSQTGLFALNGNAFGVMGSLIEAATWNIALTAAQVQTEITELNQRYPTLAL
jgi:hypothetical protein